MLENCIDKVKEDVRAYPELYAILGVILSACIVAGTIFDKETMSAADVRNKVHACLKSDDICGKNRQEIVDRVFRECDLGNPDDQICDSAPFRWEDNCGETTPLRLIVDKQVENIQSKKNCTPDTGPDLMDLKMTPGLPSFPKF